MVTVKIDESDLLDLLMERVGWNIKNAFIQKLYHIYYSKLINNGVFEGATLDINITVDEDCNKNFDVYFNIEEIMEDFKEDKEKAKERIVAEYDGYYLVRYCI